MCINYIELINHPERMVLGPRERAVRSREAHLETVFKHSRFLIYIWCLEAEMQQANKDTTDRAQI